MFFQKEIMGFIVTTPFKRHSIIATIKWVLKITEEPTASLRNHFWFLLLLFFDYQPMFETPLVKSIKRKFIIMAFEGNDDGFECPKHNTLVSRSFI